MSTHSLMTVVSVVAMAAAPAAQKSLTTADLLHASVTIQSIDKAHRLVTFRDADGNTDTVVAPPEVKRFNELKAGDKLNLSYYQSRVFTLKKRGYEPPKPTGTSGTVIARRETDTPAAIAAEQTTQIVTVKSTDLANGLISVVTEDGRVYRRKLEDKSLLQGVVADDRIEITHTQALLAEIERP